MPKSYLKRWENSDGLLRVTELIPRRSYLKRASGAARQTDYYRIESDDVDPATTPPLLFELLLGEVEGNAATAIRALLQAATPYEIDPELGYWMSLFIAFQWVRGEAFRAANREMVAEVIRHLYSDISNERIAETIRDLGEEPTPERIAQHTQAFEELRARRIRAVPQTASLISLAGQIAAAVADQLFARRWAIYRAPLPLITSDEPVLVLGGPGMSRRRRAGIAVAGAVALPIAPDTLLALFHPLLNVDDSAEWPELTLTEVAECNLEVAANSSRWVFEHPGMNYAGTLTVPIRPPASIVDVYPSVQDDRSELLHSFRTSRWALTENPPPWPMARWWRPGWALPLSLVEQLSARAASERNPFAR